MRATNHVGMTEHHVLHKNFYMKTDIPLAGCAHQAGTCRFGADPPTSVLDVNCKAHEVGNCTSPTPASSRALAQRTRH